LTYLISCLFDYRIDKNTRLILYKLQNAGVLTQINGIIAQGKEAFVFHCLGVEGLYLISRLLIIKFSFLLIAHGLNHPYLFTS
jgi:serine/threonine-protein kinase RIO1